MTDPGALDLLISVVLFGPPVPKARPRVVNGHAHTPKRTQEYEALLGYVVRGQYPDIQPDKTHEFRVDMAFFVAGRRRMDLDNLCKSGLDALNNIVWGDDSQVVDLHGHLFRGSHYPRTEIRVWREEVPDATK